MEEIQGESSEKQLYDCMTCLTTSLASFPALLLNPAFVQLLRFSKFFQLSVARSSTV